MVIYIDTSTTTGVKMTCFGHFPILFSLNHINYYQLHTLYLGVQYRLVVLVLM